MNKSLSLLFLLLLGSIIPKAQDTIDIRLVDLENQRPVDNAFLFFENTTSGFLSDSEGKVTIVLPDGSTSSLVITHILYETILLQNMNSLKEDQIIFLSEKDITLQDITIKSKRTKSKKRKRWLKRFEKELIGDKSDRRKVKLLNPEVVWFEEKDGTLVAKAIDNLIINNQELGYNVYLALDSFLISSNNDILYRGKVFFDDLISDISNGKSTLEQRKNTYLHTKTFFFKTLKLQDPICLDHFQFGRTAANANGALAYKELTMDSIIWRYGYQHDTLFFQDYLTVQKKDLLLKVYKTRGDDQNKGYQYSYETSFLRSSTGYFVIDQHGALINQQDIEESGYWTKHRLAKELPSDYKSGIQFKDASQLPIIAELRQYLEKKQSEKVYLHVSKNNFVPTEALWFRGYILDASTHAVSQGSQVLYAELVDPTGKISKTWMLHNDVGLHADYQWKPTDLNGRYLLRAYTNHMKNEDTSLLFEKEIYLTNPIDEAKSKTQEVSDSILVHIYPEGGDLIDGVNCPVVIHMSSKSIISNDINARVVDSEDQIIADITISHYGLGKFNINPSQEKQYYIELYDEQTTTRVPMPKVQPKGITCSVNAQSKDDIFISVKASSRSSLEGAYLIGHVRGKIVAVLSELQSQAKYKLDKSSFDAGIIHFTLFDKEDRPQAERLVFNDKYFTSKLDVFSSDISNETLSIEIDATLQSKLSASVSITSGVSEDPYNIANYLYLESDIASRIPNLSYYLTDITNEKRYYLDMMLQKETWRRFTWKDIAEQQEDSDQFIIEKGYQLSGRTTVKDGEKGISSDVMLTSLSSDFHYDQTTSGDVGIFRFSQIPLLDSTTLVIQSRKGKGINDADGNIKLKGDRLVDIYLDGPDTLEVAAIKTPSFFSADSDNTEEDEDLIYKLNSALMLNDSSIWAIEAPEVSITAQKKFTTNRDLGGGRFVLFDNADWIPDEANGINLLSKVSPLRRYYAGGAENKIYSIFTNYQGEEIYVPIQIIIDGMGAEPGGSSAQRFYGLSADMIESMYVSKAAVVITTRKIPRSRQRYLESGIIHLYHPGYHQAREFSRNDAISNLTPSSTLYWNPDIQVSTSGKLEIEIPISTKVFTLDIQGILDDGTIINEQRTIFKEEVNP